VSTAITAKKFRQSVAEAIRDGFLKDLAREFEVLDSTVSMWADGTDRPPLVLQEVILLVIERMRKANKI
jgi:hypothetical protein